MDLPTYFSDFLSEIRPTKEQKAELKEAHKTLRKLLNADESLGEVIVSTFLQGSYRRATLVQPKESGKPDIDVVVVTKLSEKEYTPKKALEAFATFLDEHYKGKHQKQGRSIGIELDEVKMDLVVTSAPSESQIGILESASVSDDSSLEEDSTWYLSKSWKPGFQLDVKLAKSLETEEWAQVPLRIPDQDAKVWDDTDPLGQLRHTKKRNKATSGNFVNVVKAVKWWKQDQTNLPKHPKGYPLERMVDEHCPDSIKTVAEGLALTLEKIVSAYAAHRKNGTVPHLKDRGIVTKNVLGRIQPNDFATFYDAIVEAAKTARRALDEKTIKESAKLWRELLGDKFPEPPGDESNEGGGFSKRTGKTTLSGGRFA